MGDKNYHLAGGGPIGLELTQAVARPFMMRWDRLYLDKVKRAGIDMKMYDRYIDDSNQVAVVPLPGSRYDTDSGKVVIDQDSDRTEENDDKRLAGILKSIANDVQMGIQMEDDYPSNNGDGRMPILDMKVWTDNEDGCILYCHYQKPMATTRVMHAQSAQSSSCKMGVHTQEVIRRLLNSSVRLNWNQEVAPIITTYMSRMMTAGYDEKFRKRILEKALNIYDKMRREDAAGVRPLHRPRWWEEEKRIKEKRKKKYSWSTKGGFVAPIFVPSTPNGELARLLKEVADREADAGVRFKIIETGGSTIQSVVQKSNPTETVGCTDRRCIVCKDGTPGRCRQSNINYEIECQLCPDGQRSKYLGESSRNMFTRGMEHESSYRNQNQKSFMLKHQRKKHNGVAGDYTAKVVGSDRDCLTRQVREAVRIRRCQVPVLNGKSEWHQPALWQVQSEIYRG